MFISKFSERWGWHLDRKRFMNSRGDIITEMLMTNLLSCIY